MILLFLAVIVVIYALVKRQYVIALIGVEVGLFGALQELLQKPELAQYTELMVLGGQVCLLGLAITAIWSAVGRAKKDDNH